MTVRDLDVVLFGATGFTGRLVAEALASRANGLKWALAGRSEAKIRTVRDALARSNPESADVPILVADAADEARLGEIARRTKVVCTTVGPYAVHGLPLVAACANTGTDYCDLTGEVQFVRASVDGYHARAKETGARIVHSCGFDSIPSDLGVLSLHEYFRKKGQRLAGAKFVLGAARGGFSGGTVASLLGAFDQMKTDPSLGDLLADPYALSPDRTRDRGPDGPDQQGMAFDRTAGVWTAPFVMAPVNTRVVRRSNALLDWAYGREFRYAEVSGSPRGLRGFLHGVGITLGLGLLGLAVSRETTRPLVFRALPKPGEGPSEKVRATGFFRARIFGTAEGSEVPSAVCRVEGKGDPGYAATSRMLAESAILLAETAGTGRQGGVLTPASGLGLALADRLRNVGVRFDVDALG